MLFGAAPYVAAQDDSGNARGGDFRSLEEDVQALKNDTLAINRQLFSLEEELLYPTSTQVAVFLSVDTGQLFKLDAVEIKIDDKTVSNHLYTEHEVEALHRGGIHRIYVGNLPAGEHELVAFFTGLGPQGQAFRRGANLKFEKALGSKYLELQVVDNEARQQPEFRIKEWD
ncbi:MAG: AraC family transcriptional regulator [Gammaproteobacteria bacterium]|nr:AraC family transcriptional regulator [Gammaproteobacteria bacterium]